MAALLLDSNVIIDALTGRRGRSELLEREIAAGNSLACTSIQITEIYAGMRDYEEARTNALLRSLDYFPVTWDIARLAGRLKSEWKQKGHTLMLPDATIAAVALHHNLPLLTENRKHFPMPGLLLHTLP